MSNEHKQHRDRVRQEFRHSGMDHFPDHKVLEMMLFYIFRQGDTNPLAHRLIERFGSFSGVLDAPYDLLMEVPGVGVEVATFLKAQVAFIKRYLTDTHEKSAILTIDDAKDYVQYRFLSDPVERVILICLGVNGRILYSNTLAKGTLERVDIVPSDVIKLCLRANAAKAILAHNHPCGFCNPSRRDKMATTLLHEELRRVDVDLYDHIIIAPDGVFSMRESDMLPKPSAFSIP